MTYAVFCEGILLFYCYAFLGWCAEVSYHAVITGRFVNRGFLNGPLCPIYGFGVMAVILLLSPFQENGLLLFFASLILTSILEFFTGFLLEKLFHARWWDYSQEPFHLGPYVCLRFSLLWGFACVFVVQLLHPFFISLIAFLPLWLQAILLSILSAGLIVDLWATVASVTKMFRYLVQLDSLSQEIHHLSNRLGEKISDSTLELLERQKQSKERLSEYKEHLEERREQLISRLEERRESFRLSLAQLPRSHRRLLRAFPSLQSIAHPHILKILRDSFEHRKKD
ncbi:MAG: rane protein [Firmicutes bacterium]|nr:rane protein [Bacillota bacterium]